MSDVANKAIMIGVGLFVTMMIVSGIMFIFSQIQDIYKYVENNDTTISSRFSKFASYENTELTGLDVINCANKYYNENLVVVIYKNMQVNNPDGIAYLDTEHNNGNLNYEDLYSSKVEEIEYDGLLKTTITFTKK